MRNSKENMHTDVRVERVKVARIKEMIANLLRFDCQPNSLFASALQNI